MSLRLFCYKKGKENIYNEKNTKSILRIAGRLDSLSTDRHKKYGFDDDMICVDIRSKTSMVTKSFSHSKDWFHLDFNGLTGEAKEKEADFVLYVYSQKADEMQFFKYISVDFQDLYHVAELQIEKLYDLDKYLGKLKKKDFKVVT